jgi:preprotein translocase subunit SecA
MLKKIVKILGGDPNKKAIEGHSLVVEQINDLEAEFESLSNEALSAKTDEFRSRLAKGETLEDILPEAFAVVREVSKRTIGLRHYDVQLIGGIVLGLSQALGGLMSAQFSILAGHFVFLAILIWRMAQEGARNHGGWQAGLQAALGLSARRDARALRAFNERTSS